MQNIAGQFVFSPSDLNHFLECEHLVQLHLARDVRVVPEVRDGHAELLRAKGLEHEAAWLTRFREEGRRVVDIDVPAGERHWERDADRTMAAMRAGAEVIYRGVLIEEGWHGISDFLVRVDTPCCAFGGWSYEAWDTKLARQSKPYFVLQLCFYTAQLERLQGRAPLDMHVVLGTGERTPFRYADFAAYYRAVRSASSRRSRTARRSIHIQWRIVAFVSSRTRARSGGRRMTI